MNADLATRAQVAFLLGGVAASGAAGPELRHRRAGAPYMPDAVVPGTVAALSAVVTVRFELPAPATADFIQMRIPAVPGPVHFLAMRLDGAPVADFARRVVSVGHGRFQAVGQDAARIDAGSRRPVVEVDLRGLPGGDALAAVEVDIVREAPVEEVLEVIAREARGLGQLVEERTHAIADVAFAHGDALRRHEAQLDAVEHVVRASIDRLAVDMQAHAGAAASDNAALAAEVGRLAAAVAALHEGQVHAAAQATRLQAQASQLQEQVREVAWSIRNVFWRRWLRRLRGAA